MRRSTSAGATSASTRTRDSGSSVTVVVTVVDMWNETIAAICRRGRAALRASAGRLITGPAAFLVAGVIDLLAVLWWLRVNRRSGRLS